MYYMGTWSLWVIRGQDLGSVLTVTRFASQDGGSGITSGAGMQGFRVGFGVPVFAGEIS